MNPTVAAGALRALLTAFVLGATAFFGTWAVTDTECTDTTVILDNGATMNVEGECAGWKPVIVATGLAFFGAFGVRTGEAILFDSRNTIQVNADKRKAGRRADD